MSHFSVFIIQCCNQSSCQLIMFLLKQSLQGAVVQRIRHNQELTKQIDAMDIKIGLLVQNRVTLQDVVAHGKTLNSVAKGKDKDKGSPRMSCEPNIILLVQLFDDTFDSKFFFFSFTFSQSSLYLKDTHP